MAHFDIPLDLPHAGTVSIRLLRHLQRVNASDSTLDLVREVIDLLTPCRMEGANPDNSAPLTQEIAALARMIVAGIERDAAQDDRVGQCVRNLFECLTLGAEGAELSLRAGENPGSPMRPV